MKIISHRGNILGPNPTEENKPSYLDAAISQGFDVEVDVRVIDDKIYLGHDDPVYEVGMDWLLERRYSLWIHCKNLKATSLLAPGFRCFGSISDPFCFMTQGYVWLNDVEVEPMDNCIVPLLHVDDIKRYKFMGKPWGVCTDYPMEIK